MKNLVLLAFLLSAKLSNAKEDFQIIEENVPFNKFATSFTTNIIGTNEDIVMYQWQKFIEKH